MESVLSPGPRSCPGLGEQAGMWQVMGVGSGGHKGGRVPGEAMQGWRPGSWVHQGPPEQRKGQRVVQEGPSGPAAEGFGAVQLPPVLISAGQRVLHHRHHLPVHHGGALPAAPAGPGRLSQRRHLAPVWFHSRTSLLQLKPVTPKRSRPVPSPAKSCPAGDACGGRGWHGAPTRSPELPVLFVRYVFVATLCHGLHFLLE